MIPDECAAGAMDAARVSDTGSQAKKTTSREQDFKEDYAKTSPSEDINEGNSDNKTETDRKKTVIDDINEGNCGNKTEIDGEKTSSDGNKTETDRKQTSTEGNKDGNSDNKTEMDGKNTSAGENKTENDGNNENKTETDSKKTTRAENKTETDEKHEIESQKTDSEVVFKGDSTKPEEKNEGALEEVLERERERGREERNTLTNGELEEKEEKKEEEEEEEERDNMMMEGMSEEERVSSEDDEDKLVISEGIEKLNEEEEEDSKGETLGPQHPRKAPSSPNKAPSSPSKAPSTPGSPRRSEKRPGESGEACESPSKRQKLGDEDTVCLEGITSLPQLEGSLGQLKGDLEAMEFLIKQKEEEWNALIRLQKRKEEVYLRLARRRETLILRQGEGLEVGAGVEGGEEGRGNLLFLPQGGYSTLGSPQLPLMIMSQLLNSSSNSSALQMVGGPAVVRAREGSPGQNNNNNNNNISVIDIHTSNSKSERERSKVAGGHDKYDKLTRHLMKPILPKPPMVGGLGLGGMGVGLAGCLPSALSFSPTGHGPQGPTVNVQHLIAAHRKENPHTPPISSSKPPVPRRATRGAWRSRYDGDKRPPPPPRDQDRPPSVSSSSSEAESRPPGPQMPPTSRLLTLNDPSVSYKDVLLRFAELTQIEKQPGSPQISIFPVASEGVSKRGDASRDTPTTHLPSQPPTPTPTPTPTPKAPLEPPSALAKLLLESRSGVSSSGGGGGGHKGGGGDGSPNSHYLTLSALLSGSSTTTTALKEKLSQHAQSDGRGKKSGSSSSSGGLPGGGEEGGGNPKCQGCHKQRAQFVCAGCGNQWYCSRECQVAAWEEHSEHCSN